MAESEYHAYASAGIGALQRWYCPLTGRWRTTGWWNSANSLTALIAYTKHTGDRAHTRAIRTTFWLARLWHHRFINSFYDDNGWWGLAWAAAYELTGDGRYLDAAKTIFAHNAAGWDDTCRGGLYWNTSKKTKNAITNELFLTLAARLYLCTKSGSDAAESNGYRDWALKAWDWFGASGLIGADGLVNDGLTATCENNGRTTWTYNQGVILGGLAALHEITGDGAYLQRGETIADAAIAKLINSPSATLTGILTEPNEAGTKADDRDLPQFKGIFVRYLHEFYRQSKKPVYRDFILRNADSIWANSKNPGNQFGLCWAGPFDRADASRQTAALDALNAAVALTTN